MITILLKKIKMSKFFIFLIISMLFFQCKNNKTNLTQNTTKVIKKDTVFFYCKNIFEEKCIKSTKNKANVYRIITNLKLYPYITVANYIAKSNRILSKGKLIDINESNPNKAKYDGKWYFYGDADKGIYKIGNYNNGLKDGIWYTEHEDSIPKLQYYKNGHKTTFKDSIIVTNDNNKRITYGKGITRNGLPIGEWVFFLDNGNIISKREFFKKENDVIVKFINIDAKSNLIIGKGVFNSSSYE